MRRALPPIDLLRAFEACDRHLSVSRAADELNLTQSAVSRQLAALEAMLQLQLFHRVRRRLTRTLAGAAYAPEIRALLSRLETATLELMTHGGARSTLNLSVVPTFGTRWLAPRLPGFCAAHPQITINVRNFETRPGVLDFAAEHVHAAIWYGDEPWLGTCGHLLVMEEMVPVCAPQLLAGDVQPGPSAFVNYTLLHNSTRPRGWQEWFEAVGATEIGVLRGPKFQHMAMIIQAAIAGIGIALAPRALIDEELAAGQLVMLHDLPIENGQGYYLIYPEEARDFPPLRAFRDWILSGIA